MRHRIAISASLLATALCGSLLVQEYRVDEGSADSEVSADVERIFRWFDTLGFPRLAEGNMVRVQTSFWMQAEGDSPPLYYFDASALRVEEKQITASIWHLSEATVEETPEPQRTELALVPLERVAADRLRELRDYVHRKDDRWTLVGAHLTESVELFVLARACHSTGHNQLANELITQALSIRDMQTGEPVSIEQLQVSVAEDIGDAEMWRAFEAFGSLDVSRKELRRRFQSITKHFPNSRHAERAQKIADVLSMMVKEDEARAAVAHKPLDEMTVQERVTELIYQLRNQNEDAWSTWGRLETGQPRTQPIWLQIVCSRIDGSPIRLSTMIEESSPASQLIAIGEPALEQLIESFDDKRFTQGVFHRGRAIRVGEWCLAIIKNIQPTGRQFDIDGDPELAKRAMKAWYISERSDND